MNIQHIAWKQGKRLSGHNRRTWQHCITQNSGIRSLEIRCFATDKDSNSQLKADRAREHVKDLSDDHRAKKRARALDKDFFLSVLHSSATKREAKSYLQRFDPAKDASKSASTPPTTHAKPDNQRNSGVNLGSFYGPAAVRKSPKFVQQPYKPVSRAPGRQLHVALVKIRAPQTLDNKTLDGIGRTLSQLERLGLISVVIVDCHGTEQRNSDHYTWREVEAQQANRVISAIEASGSTQARLVDNVIGISENVPGFKFAQTKTHITFRDMLMKPLRKGIIPVIPSFGYTAVTQTATKVPASDVVIALTKELAGLSTATLPDEDPDLVRARLQSLKDAVSLDRLIILDPLGGIPCSDRESGYHVFLNMEQEFESAKQDLLGGLGFGQNSLDTEGSQSQDGMNSRASTLTKSTFNLNSPAVDMVPETDNTPSQSQDKHHHVDNLELARAVLALLPPSSSALITSPEEAANSGKDVPFQAAGVGTRRQRNPLIHNLLTDRPVFSSSLPAGRLGGHTVAKGGLPLAALITPTTFAKHGMSVTIFPDPKVAPWEPPIPGKPHLSLTDSQIDLPRFVHLIEDSFGRKIDVKEYLKRVDDRIAGIIIAGEYEGGALLTWEIPPGVVDDGSPESRARMVPYLDKFAVLKKRQGSATADLVFKAMVRDCFPDGVCWRSRKDNVVNKWYFERSRGTWKLPDTGWTMFWTTPDLSMDRQTFLDYESVCESIQPSWADNKALLD